MINTKFEQLKKETKYNNKILLPNGKNKMYISGLVVLGAVQGHFLFVFLQKVGFQGMLNDI